MTQLTDLELTKDFIELSILLNPEKKFLPHLYSLEDKKQKLLYKAISELKKEGKIKISVSIDGGMVIT